MSSGHGDDEGKEIIDEGVESFVHKSSPRQMGNRLQFIIEEQLWQHEQESKSINSIDSGLDGPRVPALVWCVQQAVTSST